MASADSPRPSVSPRRARSAAQRSWLRAGAAFALAVLLGCSPEKDLLAEAERQQASGETDAAIVTLEQIKANHPDSEAARKVPELAERWLLEAADSETLPQAKEPRIAAALRWNPQSGEAQLRLCQLRIQADRLEEAESCLDRDLKGKATNPDFEKRLREALARGKEAATEAERKRLIQSNRPQHWQALMERFPGTPEAALAKQKLDRMASLCADRSRFEEAVTAELKRQAGPFKAEATAILNETIQPKRVSRLESLGQAAARKASELKSLAAEVTEHTVKPGEEAAQKPLSEALMLLSDSLAALSEGLERDAIENLDSYEAGAAALLKRWVAGVEKEGKAATVLLGKAAEACSSDGGAPPSE